MKCWKIYFWLKIYEHDAYDFLRFKKELSYRYTYPIVLRQQDQSLMLITKYSYDQTWYILIILSQNFSLFQ